MVSLPSNEAIANILNGSFNVHHQQPSSVGQVKFSLEKFFIQKFQLDISKS